MRIQLQLGPLPCEDALVWTRDTLVLLDAIEGDPRLPFALPPEALISIRGVVAAMHARASSGSTFTWACDTTLADLKALITYWLNLGKLSEGTLEQIGARYSGDEGERFHVALLASFLDALDDVDPVYASRLREGWRRPIDDVVDLRAPVEHAAEPSVRR